MVHNKSNIGLEIILVLIRSKSHLREIARNLKTSHSTVSRKINELVKKDILDFEKQGKNKIFFIKNNLNAKVYVYSAEMHKLPETIKKNPELEIIFEDIKKKAQKGMILLFGSYAKGTEEKESDIDIYIETEDSSLRKKIKEINSRINVKIGGFDTNSLLIKEIIKNHVIIRGVEEFYEKSRFFEKN